MVTEYRRVSMLKDITTIKVEGANFSSLTSFKFFDPHDEKKIKTIKATLAYGKNGTGKSTIAKAFRKLSGENIPVITNAVFFDDAELPVILTEEEKRHIYIFDENYVDKNVKFQQDHLETIIMLGHAGDLTEKIEKAKSEMALAKDAYEQQASIWKDYCDASNVNCPKYYSNQLMQALRGDDNWAGRDREINNGRHNTSVKDDTYKRFVALMPSKPKTELIVAYKERLKELQTVRMGNSTIEKTVPTLSKIYTTYCDAIIHQLLATKIEKPELSEREKKLFALVQAGKADELSQRLTVFRNKETFECPYCFQSITSEQKISLVESITKVLSKIVEEHQRALRNHIIDEITIDLHPYVRLEGYQICSDLIDNINTSIQQNNANLKKKIETPYEQIITEISTVEHLVNQLSKNLANLETARGEYNNVTKKTAPIIADLNRINEEIAYYDVRDLAEQLKKQNGEYKKVESLYNELEKAYAAKKKVVEDLEAQRKSIHLALDSINACMKYIFFADDRLKIEYADGTYKLLSHGKSVRPCDISVGERNIIGLSYFFTSILEGKEENFAYGEEYLLVIDDPISSFDLENRIGILSFLKYKLSVFLEGNLHTKAIVMTHDLTTFYDFHKIFEEILNTCKRKNFSAIKFNRFEITSNGLKSFAYKTRQEYTESVKAIYAYAVSQSNDSELIIGNMMRQLLEAFATFEYRKSIEDVSTDSDILSLLQKEEYISYYKNLMYRLVLHGGSHKEEQVKSMKDLRFFSIISENEKRRTARDVLCFIYLLNKKHLLEHLKESGNVEAQIQSWCEEIKTNAAII